MSTAAAQSWVWCVGMSMCILAAVPALDWIPARNRNREPLGVNEVRARLHAEAAAAMHMPTMAGSREPWPKNHDKPEEPLSVSQAHLTMQQHRSCLREECARKLAAYQTLVDAGIIQPDTTRTYG